ncbi:ABC transporter ATP-binding protein [Blastococcus sp. BMG 814]|uniref:ABC transporter ATP-binding protein n=1 Tax=Blastococcus carthaginiensis TaxID=3050034 RepID=A0ABT9IB93_9ACTN|nr:ABC transporter ATP-binding protein [Blastococcus carthaginiensis]MDP5182502.1 ABC transporter ATP-binding protein [Blastococcus carthaginiensis]
MTRPAGAVSTASDATPPDRAVGLELQDVGITFGSFRAVAGATFDIHPGEFLCILGPSGCGKSTLLSAIAGFVEVSGGTITGEGAPVAGRNEHAGVVFQSTEVLFEWLTVRQNVMFGPKARGLSRAEQRRIADQYIAMVGLAHSADKLPGQLSGGMRQRVQLARVLANEPQLVLMDEPFGALDAQTREVMQAELARIWRQNACTVVFVTHDIDEALLLADRVLIMTAGPAAGIKRIHDVDLPRPRLKASPEFLERYERLREDIADEVNKSLRDQGLDDGASS